MVERTQDRVLINNEAEDLAEVAQDLWIRDDVLDELDAENAGQLAAALEILVQHPFNRVEGGLSALVGRVHFPLRRTLYSALALSVSLAGAVLTLAAQPVAGTIAIAGTVISAAQQASDLLTRLTSEELVVYEALAAATKQQRDNGNTCPRVTLAEVEAVFNERNEIIPDITQTLGVLRDKEVIRFEQTDAETKYWVEL